MKSNEEKVKEFFSDEKNVEKLMQDKDFMDKVSNGTVTAQDYIDEFGKFDINLTENEAEGIFKVTDKLLSVPAGKLDDELVSNVVGGTLDDATKAGVITGLVVESLGGVIGVAAFGIAGLSNARKYKQAAASGNQEEMKRIAADTARLTKESCYWAMGTTAVAAGMGVGVFGLCKLIDKLL